MVVLPRKGYDGRSATKQANKMDINDFKKATKPKAKRSKLEPFLDQIFELKKLGYANGQIVEWLSGNKIEVSEEGVRKFIKSRKKGEVLDKKKAPASPIQEAEISDQETESDTAGLSKQAQRERRAQEFIRSETTNPLLKRLLPKETKK